MDVPTPDRGVGTDPTACADSHGFGPHFGLRGSRQHKQPKQPKARPNTNENTSPYVDSDSESSVADDETPVAGDGEDHLDRVDTVRDGSKHNEGMNTVHENPCDANEHTASSVRQHDCQAPEENGH